MLKILKYFIVSLILFSYSIVSYSRTLVISDIDDTIKKANSMGGVGGVYYFLRKKPYAETRDLFNEIRKNELDQGDVVNFYYVSAAPSYTFDADEWILKNNFPLGQTFLKTYSNGGNTYDYKYRIIKAIIVNELKLDASLKVLFFGDNSQYDAKVYVDLNKEMKLGAKIYIRDVSTEATYFSKELPVVKLPGVEYFFSEMELALHPDFSFISAKLSALITANYQNESLVPMYTLDTLEDRLKHLCADLTLASCKSQAKSAALQYWKDYYTRF